MRELDGERVAVIGLGASGDAAARLALGKGAKVHVTDSSREAAVAARGDALRALGARVRLGEPALDEIVRADVVVASPGVPPDSPVLSALDARGVDWISEPEFACRFVSSPLTIVTGTNGKTTVAALAAHLLRGSGVDAALGGNVGADFGPPASALADRSPAPERFVLELSSFQLAGIRDLRPDVGVVTNLGVDHMDRYETVAAYHRDKRRLLEAGDASTTWALNGDDVQVAALARGAAGRRATFSLERRASPGAYRAGDDLVLEMESPARVFARRSDVRLAGRHNLANALAASLAAVLSGADAATLAGSLGSFAPLPHRLEPLGERDGVSWINDSKATNVAAAKSAVESFAGPLVLLLGGKDKGEDFAPLAPALAPRARAVVAYGAAGPRAAAELRARSRGALPVRLVDGSFARAVERARALARPGDALLLAPACSSFDMFADYEARGDAFRALFAPDSAP